MESDIESLHPLFFLIIAKYEYVDQLGNIRSEGFFAIAVVDRMVTISRDQLMAEGYHSQKDSNNLRKL